MSEVLSVRLREVTLGLGSCARASHTPVPSREGSFRMLVFLLIIKYLWWIWRGEFGMFFLFDNEGGMRGGGVCV